MCTKITGKCIVLLSSMYKLTDATDDLRIFLQSGIADFNFLYFSSCADLVNRNKYKDFPSCVKNMELEVFNRRRHKILQCN